ncbi:MAG: TonB-dependent receptor [Ignavibacteriae bacterium]|nr:TonB-dependent receptor [Ignavibacteriota bacterium]
MILRTHTNRFGAIWAILHLCMMLGAGSYAQGQNARLEGVVLSEVGPLVGATVRVLGTGSGGLTDADGRFRIDRLEARVYQVQVSMIGFESRNVRMTASSDPAPQRVQLIERPVVLDAVEVVSDALRRPAEDTRVSVQQLQPREAKILPGAGEDVMRSLQSLPGVVAPNDFSSQLIIRGSGPDQNLIVMDEIEVFNPYRLYGAVSMFNPETITDISLISGGFPARYGDRLSAVLDVTNRNGNADRAIGANINMSITNANVVLEGSNPGSIPGSWLLSTRRTYYDLILGPIARQTGLVTGDVAFPNFRDVQAKLSFGPFNHSRFVVNALSSRDGVDLVTGEGRETPDSVSVFNTLFNTVLGAAWYYTPNERLVNKLVLSYYDNTGTTEFDGRFLDPVLNREEFRGQQTDSLRAMARLFGISFDNEFRFRKTSVKNMLLLTDESHALDAGVGVDVLATDLTFAFRVSPELRQIIEANPRSSALVDDIAQSLTYVKAHAYVQDRILLGTSFAVTPGIRVDYYGQLESAVVSPRLSASYAVDPVTTFRASTGLYYQSPGYEKLFDQNQFFDFSSDNLRTLSPERAWHAVLGLERWIDEQWLARVETYYKRFADLIVQKKTSALRWESDPTGVDPRTAAGWSQPSLVRRDSLTSIPINGARGDAFGMELMLEKRSLAGDDRLSGWVSYALAWAYRERDGVHTPFNFDQRHTANIVGNYRVLPWLDIGAFWRIGSNFPITQPRGVRPRIVLEQGVPQFARDFSGNVILDIDYGDEDNINQSRKPLYHRLDLRATATTRFWNADWSFYLDIINAYNHGNVASFRYFVDASGRLGRRTVTMFPLLPTLGVSARF